MPHTFTIGGILFAAVWHNTHWRLRIEETGEMFESITGGVSIQKMKASIQDLLDRVSKGDAIDFRKRWGLGPTPPEQINLLIDDTKERIEKLIRIDSSLEDFVAFKVTTPEGERILHMTHGLTDRWGDINRFSVDNRFSVALFANGELLSWLQGAMVGQESFITATPKGFAIHVEKEYHSKETCSAEDFEPKHAFAEIQKICIDAIPALREKWPDVTFCIGDTDWTFGGRVALWAVVQPGRYTPEQLEAMLSDFPT